MMKRIDSEGVGDNDGFFEVEAEPTDWLKEVRRLKEENQMLREAMEKQKRAALRGMDAAKEAGSASLREAQRIRDELKPELLESERAMNAELTEENQRLRARVAELERDAARYRFLRDEDNWGDDSGETSWERLAEATLGEFDAIIDARMGSTAATDTDNGTNSRLTPESFQDPDCTKMIKTYETKIQK